MQIHNLQRNTKRLRHRQLGRGGKRGKTSGRGTKGQKARAGRKIRPEFRDVIKRLPKMRGRGKNSFKSIQSPYVTVSFAKVVKTFPTNTKVNPAALLSKGLILRYKGQLPRVKIVGPASAGKKYTIADCNVTASVKAEIEKAGGVVLA